MDGVKIVAMFGDQERTVSAELPSGAGGNSYHVYIDKFYNGVILFPENQPVRWYLHESCPLCLEDIQILVEMLDEQRAGRQY